MNLSNSPSGSTMGFMGGVAYSASGAHIRPSNLTAKGAVATYDRIVNSTKSVRT
jgi:hypothetical protein